MSDSPASRIEQKRAFVADLKRQLEEAKYEHVRCDREARAADEAVKEACRNLTALARTLQDSERDLERLYRDYYEVMTRR